ncbi:ntl-11, partial [Pristionchus pacificus]|uniref:CCR4-NOT transcription complex subunit 11 n=1 Tax=Pristionchus pacificus TaxID=54126 RepID=A0A2A6BYW6_PRIPA
NHLRASSDASSESSDDVLSSRLVLVGRLGCKLGKFLSANYLASFLVNLRADLFHMTTLEDLRKASEFVFTGDNGDVSPEDKATFNILISQHREPLAVLALKLLTTYRRRCSWSVAVALIDLYINLYNSNPLDIHSRVILIYLIFRVAELDGTDVNGRNIMKEGHLSLPFLLAIANGEEISLDRTSIAVEKYLAKMILSAQVDSLALNSATRIVESVEAKSHEFLSLDEVTRFFAVESVRFPRSSEERQREEQLDAIATKLLSGKVLNMSENRTLVDAISRSNMNSILIQKFRELPAKNISKLIDENVKIAAEVVYKLVENDPDTIHYYMSILMGMELSVHCIETVLKLYTGTIMIDRDPLRAFVSHCLQACDDVDISSSKQSRQVRMVCLFVSCLLKKNILPVEQQMTELSNFVLNHSSHRDTTNLYQQFSVAKIIVNFIEMFLPGPLCGILAYPRQNVLLCITYHINSIPLIPPSDKKLFVKDLGVFFTPSLSFSEHINKFISKSRSKVNLLFKSFRSTSPTIYAKSFTTFILPHLEYGSIIWNPVHSVELTKSVEKVQRDFTRRLYIRCNLPHVPYRQRLIDLNMMTLENRRTMIDLSFVHSILHKRTLLDTSSLLYLSPLSRPLRNSHNLRITLPFLPPSSHSTYHLEVTPSAYSYRPNHPPSSLIPKLNHGSIFDLYPPPPHSPTLAAARTESTTSTDIRLCVAPLRSTFMTSNRKSDIDDMESGANGGSLCKMNMTIVISTLENPKTRICRESNFFDCARLFMNCPIPSRTGSYRVLLLESIGIPKARTKV